MTSDNVERRPEEEREGSEPRSRNLLKMLGPGLVTGASDDDPSGIATYSQVGAQFGYQLLWSVVFTYPLMVSVQEISARIGRVTGRGLAGNIRRNYSPWLLYPIVALLLIANTINLGADIGAMGAACALLVGGPAILYAAGFAVLCIVLQVFIPYTKYANMLKWLTLVVFAYVATVFVVKVPWGLALRGALLPRLSLNSAALAALVAVLGTTISPYLFFWQASQESEEVEVNDEDAPLKRAPEQAREQLTRIRLDTFFGMFVSNLVAFFIILTAAVTLHARGVHDIQTSAQAAEALRPVAGRFASTLFALGIVGTGLLAVPVLAGSAAYAVGEALRWPVGLERKPLDARGFYAVLAVATLLGLGMVVIHIDPIKALFWSAVINGVVAVPVMVVLMRMAGNPRVMGKFVITGRWLRVVGWVATGVMAAASVAMFATMGR